MRSMLQLLGGVAVAGAVAAGSTAFTNTGLLITGAAATPQFIGGSVTQTVTGAVLDTITYGYDNATTKTAVNSIVFHFADVDSDGKTLGLSVSGGAWPAAAGGVASAFTCEAIADTTTKVATCTANGTGGYTGLDSITVTVS